MAENRIQDWIRYVQENSENLNAETAQTSDERLTRRAARDEARSAPKSTAPREEPNQTAAVVSAKARKKVGQTPTGAATATAATARAAASTTHPSSTRTSNQNVGERARRVRLRLETRAQMLARLTNPVISLHEASVILGVCSATVRRYSDLGTLPHVRTQGGQRRFRLREVLTLAHTLETKKRKRQ